MRVLDIGCGVGDVSLLAARLVGAAGNVLDAAQIDIDTLADRLRDDAVTHERVSFLPRVVGAWVRLPQAGASVQ